MQTESEQRKEFVKRMGLKQPLPRGIVRLDIEAKLPYKVDPDRNYRAEIDAQVPPWEAEKAKTVDGSSATFHDPIDDKLWAGKPRTVYNPSSGQEWALPHYRYVRALHPSGEVRALIASSCRPGPMAPDGYDQAGNFDRIIGAKRREAGWLLLEPGSEYNGRTGNEYLAWCFAVAEWRRANYLEQEAADRLEHANKGEQLLKEMVKQQQAALGPMVASVAEAVTAGIVKGQREAAAEERAAAAAAAAAPAGKSK